jgi:hypothetical protein
MSTTNCGCPETPCTATIDPCTNKGCPIPPTDAECIYFNLFSDSGLPCIGVTGGTNLKTILEKIDVKLCSINPYDFSAYDLKCLDDTTTILTFKNFAEAVATQLCQAKTNIATLTNTLSALSTTVDVNNVPVIADNCSIGILPNDTVKQVLQKLVNKICTLTPTDVSPSIGVSSTNSISFLASGTKNHNISANVRVSPNIGNTLQTLVNGLYVATPASVAAQTLSYNTLSRELAISGGNSITLPPDLDNQTLSLNLLTNILTISGGNSVDFTPLFSAISITETDITANDSQTINFTTSGTADHTLTGSVIVDNTQPNALIANSNGLYVAPVSVPLQTGQNGITTNLGLIELGGSLIKDTVLSEVTGTHEFALEAKNIWFGNDYLTYLNNFDITQFGVVSTKNVTDFLTYSNMLSSFDLTIDGGFSTGKVFTASNNGLVLNLDSSSTVPNSTVVGANVSTVNLKTNNENLTFSQATDLVGTSVRALYTSRLSFQILEETTTSSTISHAATLAIGSPYYVPGGVDFATITNYYGILLNRSNSFNLSLITNRWGIYQEGESDNNYFAGFTSFGNTTTPTSQIDIATTNGYQALRLRNDYTPSATGDTNGEIGNITWDDSFIYIKTSVGWKKATLAAI